MDYYKEMYYKLFNKVADVIGELQMVQQETEELFLLRGETTFDEIYEANREAIQEEITPKNKSIVQKEARGCDETHF